MTCEELLELKENTHFEAKAALGRDGNGELPKEIWETYIAFANTEGGTILLGAKECKDGSLEFHGIGDIEKVQQQLWTQINNPQKISRNILSPSDVHVIHCEEVDMLLIKVPRADRKDKPVYLGHNPMTGTYLRYHEADIKAKQEVVQHMIADAVQESNDTKILQGFDLDDIDTDTLARYRNVFNASKIDHPFSGLDSLEFLKSIGAYAKDRQTNTVGLTIAGLLMFGKMRSILDGIPHYLVDYQEQSDDPEERWIDRITTDGTWSGNLYDFASKSYRKLTDELKVPFRLKDNIQRIDEGHVHQALREALVNTLIHANYQGGTGILIVKHPKGFVFRNPGLLRIPLDKAFQGGNSDCRNRTLQKMFQFIGWGEQAGSGFPKMMRAWHEQHWQRPVLDEDFQSEFTTLILPTVSLIPEEIQEELLIRFGDSYNELDKDARIALVIAYAEGQVSNHRLSEIIVTHPSDTTKMLRSLVDKGFLTYSGVGRGTVYMLRDDNTSLQHIDDSLQHIDEDLQHLPHVEEVRIKPKVPREVMHKAIVELCSGQYRTIQQLATLLNRSVGTLRNHYIPVLLKTGVLETKYSDPNHPDQAYKTSGMEVK